MGRAKITMKFIQNQKARKLAFVRRQNGLIKKVCELSRKFGVEACLVVYDGDDGNARPITWPEDTIIVHSMIKKYEQQKIETTPKKFDVNDYFANRKNMVGAEISKLHKKIVMNKYPTWSPCFHTMEGEQLKGFIDIVDAKIQACNNKIIMLKNMQQSDKTQQNIASTHSSQLDLTHSISQMQYISCDPIDNMMVEPHQEHANNLDEFPQLDYMMLKPQNSTSDLASFEEWATQLDDDDTENWNTQLDLSSWQDISFIS
ncbi:unnamed protein product [Vicia faba]|uniref:MADS-box domain-containing protein n=1 Tax=Vicia faba TaxID=3906 RepID=A0AAV0YVX5_VICFA|nr:unnamed protein product [Vicia faba]